MAQNHAQDDASTGIPGLAEVMKGGYPRHRVCVVQGEPGIGKTTLGLHFLIAGCEEGEKTLYITLCESSEELKANALSHEWSLDGIRIFDVPFERGTSGANTVFPASEVELSETIQWICEEVEREKPERVVLDSLAELRLLTESPLQYRRQILMLKDFLADKKCTVLLLSDRRAQEGIAQVNSIAHGVLILDRYVAPYGDVRRQVEVLKMRGRGFRGGKHDYEIVKGGLVIYPNLVASETALEPRTEPIMSGISEIDDLLGGGLVAGSGTLIMGAAGTGKSTLAAQYTIAALDRGQRALIFTFEEPREFLLGRLKSFGIDADRHLESGSLVVHETDARLLSLGKFSNLIKCYVEEKRPSIVVIDSLNALFLVSPNRDIVTMHLYELLSYLRRKRILTMMILAQSGLVGENITSPLDVSYLSDVMLMLRHFEARGKVRQALSVVKKRTGHHEKTIREFEIRPDGIRVGAPLMQFQGILSGIPQYIGAETELLNGGA